MHDIEPASLRAFVAVVDHGGVTAAARHLNLTQSAVSQKIRKLEALLDAGLFDRTGNRLRLNRQGELILGYARGVLRLNDELRTRLGAPAAPRTVRFGIPDLYAAYLMPRVMGEFGRTFPEIQTALHCALSDALLKSLREGALDLALVTRAPHMSGGQTVRREQLIWIAGIGSNVCRRNPLPLAMLPAGNLYRNRALDALERVGRSSTVVCESESIGGLYAAVISGLAVSVVARCAVHADVRTLDRADGLPPLPAVELALYRAPNAVSDAVRCLEDYIIRSLSPA